MKGCSRIPCAVFFCQQGSQACCSRLHRRGGHLAEARHQLIHTKLVHRNRVGPSTKLRHQLAPEKQNQQSGSADSGACLHNRGWGIFCTATQQAHPLKITPGKRLTREHKNQIAEKLAVSGYPLYSVPAPGVGAG